MLNIYTCNGTLVRRTETEVKSIGVDWHYGSSHLWKHQKALADATMFIHTRLDVPTSIMTDTSDLEIGGVQQQFVDGKWTLHAFFSKPAKCKYSTLDKELLNLNFTICHFHYFLKRKQFAALKYHKPLTLCIAKDSASWLACPQRHLSYIPEFTTDIKHIYNWDNCVQIS